MRDLVALSALPAIWSGLDPQGIASSLSDVLLDMLSLAWVYLRLGTSAGQDAVEVLVGRHPADKALDEAAKASLRQRLSTGRGELPAAMPDPLGSGTVFPAVIRFGVGPDHGVLVAASRQSNFPTEQERLLLGVGANQAAIVVQRRQVECQVQEQREWLHVTLASIGDAVIATDIDGAVTFLNDAAEALTGWVQREAAGQPLDLVFRIVDEATRQPGDSPAEAARRAGERVSLAGRPVLIARDGAEQPIDGTAAPIRNAAGDLLGIVIVFRCTRAQRRAEQHRNARLGITQVLNESQTVQEAAVGVLQAVCDHLLWDAGFFWFVDEDGKRLECRAHWHCPGVGLAAFQAESLRVQLMPGEGLPGRVWTDGTPTWISNLHLDGNFKRLASAAQAGMRCAFACPVSVAGRAIGVMEFFTARHCECDPDLLEMMGTAAGNVGQFIERKWAEDELKRSEEELAEFFENATVGLHWVGADGKILRVNRAELELLGYSREEYLGHHISEFHADQDVICDILGRLSAGEKLTEYPARLKCKDGSIKHVLIDSSVRWKDERFIHTRCFTRDVTERTRAEAALADARARLQAALDAGSIATWTWDIPGNALIADSKLSELFNLSADQATGAPLDRYLASIHPQDLERITRALQRAVERDEPYEEDYRVVQADGSVRWVTARGKAERDAAGRPVRMPGVLVDITARKLLEEALRDADRRKDEFLATLAHELRNPLAPIRNGLQILKMSRAGADTIEQTRSMMERQVQHLVRLVDDLLDVSRVMRGKIELRKEPVELAGVIARAVETVQPLVAAQRHRLELSIPKESLLVKADPVRLTQVLGNLLTNAAKYTDPNGHIRLSAACEGQEIVLRVKDNGIGIAPELLPHIFELFVQADATSTKAQGGLGIGLTLARNLVQMHGGTITAHSAGEGRGSEFTVRLPLLPERHEGPSRPLDISAERVTSAGCRVLVVDDNEDAATSLSTLLRLQGHEVQIAHDGESALAAAPQFLPHVVFLDIGMPGMDGCEVARSLRRQPGLEDVVLAALTGWGQKQDRRRTREAGFDHHLVKPPEAAALERVLNDCMTCRANTLALPVDRLASRDSPQTGALPQF